MLGRLAAGESLPDINATMGPEDTLRLLLTAPCSLVKPPVIQSYTEASWPLQVSARRSKTISDLFQMMPQYVSTVAPAVLASKRLRTSTRPRANSGNFRTQ